MAALQDVYVDPSLQARATVTLTHTTTTAHVAHTAHGYATSDVVKIHGVTQAAYNGNFTITKIDNDNYDYTMGSDPGANGTGAPRASKVNSGDGSSGTPWPDTQYGLDTMTIGSGAFFHIKAGTDEILANPLTGPAGITWNKPLIFRGYTTTKHDRGIGGIDGDGSHSMFSAAPDGIILADMHCHNSGSATIINFGRYCCACNVEVDNTTGTGISMTGTEGASMVVGCNIHNIGTYGVDCHEMVSVLFNYFQNGTNEFSRAINVDSKSVAIIGNIFSLTNASDAIHTTSGGWGHVILGNSGIASSSTGVGVNINTYHIGTMVLNNIFEGFNENFKTTVALQIPLITGGNAAFNAVTTDFAWDADTSDNNIDIGNADETTSATPFDKGVTDNFANRYTYFAPADEGAIQTGGYPEDT